MLNPALMPFKKNLPEASSVPALSGFSLLGIEGADAESFLQAQTMNDVRALAAGRWQWNGWLNPKGRVIALFALARIANDAFIAILPDFPASELLPLLQRFVFRSKVKLRVRDDLICAGELETGPSPDAATDRVDGTADTGFLLDFSGAEAGRSLWLMLPGAPALLPSNADNDTRWLEQDLRHGLPRLPVGQREAWTPQMLSLERLNAFSLKKGCYPGQEIVARTHYLGQSKRTLRCFRGEGLAVAASVADASETSIGSVIATSADGRTALAVCSRDTDPNHLRVAERPVELLPLLPGLARPLVTEVTLTGSQMPETGA
jgi:folate-binding protein YgfZ